MESYFLLPFLEIFFLIRISNLFRYSFSNVRTEMEKIIKNTQEILHQKDQFLRPRLTNYIVKKIATSEKQNRTTFRLVTHKKENK